MKNTNKKSKFDENYVGPYEVVELTGENTIKIKRRGKTVRAHKDHIKKFREESPEN